MPRLLPDLATRDRQPELMDQPGLSESVHRQALAGLARVNRISFTTRTLWPPLAACLRRDTARHWRLLDVACGAGDVPLALAQRAARAGLSLRVAGCDRSETALDEARKRASAARIESDFFSRDVLAQGLPRGYDIITCSLFLHHLDEHDAVALLSEIGATARTLALVSDLRRTHLGYLLATIGTRLLSRSSIVHTDGPLSVRAAFTTDEARHLAEQAGLTGRIHLRHTWPQRFLIIIEPSPIAHSVDPTPGHSLPRPRARDSQ
jgi:2-polyprenyl-3-methyl-5-hydroxy-6-metoxy-1,4-benzoquinol methylase